jgi:predicted amidohydrolase YtcJ
MMGGAGLEPGPRGDRLCVGELKILLDEDRLPDLDALTAQVREAHAGGRGVAFHCVSRTELVYALHVLEAAGTHHDRIEHAAVTPPELFAMLRALGVAIVTQPGFIAERGDRYLAEADADEIPHLYRLQSFLAHGIPLALSSDAPYGDPDPWRAMRAAVERRTRGGAIVDAAEALTPEAALHGFLGPADRPGRASRTIAPGALADVCLLDRPWREARLALDAGSVRLTLVGGEVVHDRASR